MFKYYLSIFFIISSFYTVAQTDTIQILDEVIVKGFETKQTRFRTPASISLLTKIYLEKYKSSVNPLPYFNSQPGVRMEERSPGSLRLAIRGSAIRSPYGVRNVKVYWNNLPMSDANGTTYLNQVDFNTLGTIEMIKGPASSIFGASYGGVVQLNTVQAEPGHSFTTGIHLGHYNTFTQDNAYSFASQKINLTTGFKTFGTNGYRDHSAAKGYNFVFSGSYFIHPKHTLTFSQSTAFIDYKTPGGLTLAQLKLDRRASRPATTTLPSSKDQNAAIVQNFTLTGITHNWKINPKSELSSSIFYAQNTLTNPFITSYEERSENTKGYRIVGQTQKKHFLFYLGSEGIFTHSTFDVKKNNLGIPGNPLYFMTLNSEQLTHFFQTQVQLPWQVNITAGISFNQQTYKNTTQVPNEPLLQLKEKPTSPWSPRIAILKEINHKSSIFFSLSNGFSPPTAQEITSNFENNHGLQLKSEQGISRELGMKIRWARFLNTEISGYYQTVKNALVRAVLENGGEYFMNSGKISQKGLELSNNLSLTMTNRFISKINLILNGTYSHYTFSEYINDGINLAGKSLPGSPKLNTYLAFSMAQKNGFYLHVDANYLSAMYLNSQNTIMVKPYTNSQGRFGWQSASNKKLLLNIYTGLENILNQEYSLGYDFNAIGNRFYNPAPKRTVYGGLRLTLKI